MGVSHFYMTAHGEFSGPWAGEFAQIGSRVCFRPQGTDPSPLIQLPDGGDIEQTFTERDITNFTVTQTFDYDLPWNPRDFWDTMDDCADDFRTFLTATQGAVATLFRWTEIKVAPIELGTGKYLAPASVYTLKSPLTGGATGMLPPECAIAVSLRTAVVGKRGRGRMYIPALGQGSTIVTADGRVTPGMQNTLATALKQYVTDIREVPGSEVFRSDVVICSANSRTAVIPQQVRVGDHVDAQRRRQHQVEEIYVTQTI